MAARKMSITMTDAVCGVVVWNKTVCSSISQKILKEKLIEFQSTIILNYLVKQIYFMNGMQKNV